MNPYKNKHDPLNFNMVDGVKIYTGTTQYSKKNLDSNIEYYKSKITKKIFTELVPSTLTAKGSFNNVKFNEEDIIDMLSEPIGGYILKIGCNYGTIINKSPKYDAPPVKVRLSKRGRKPKQKVVSKRKIQGSGKYFSSQITFEIYNPDNDKIYKIKLFRNGGFQVPGIKKPDMSDLIKPIRVLRDYLRLEFVDEDIDIQYFISVMRNYICRIKNPKLLIRLNELEILFKNQKKLGVINPVCEYLDAHDDFTEPALSIIKDYIGNKINSIGIAEIQNNCERYFGLILKFHRPVPWRLDKRATIKALRSNKINIDGGNSIEECDELYYWLEYILSTNPMILFDPDNVKNVSSSYELDSGCESIYDEDLSDD